jgi:hypothetical protein
MVHGKWWPYSVSLSLFTGVLAKANYPMYFTQFTTTTVPCLETVFIWPVYMNEF